MGNKDISCNTWSDKAFKGIVVNQNWNYVCSHNLNLSIDSMLIKLLCGFVNFEEMKKEIYKMIFKKKIMESFKSNASKIKNPRFFQQISRCNI